jgi:hypothetical protein
LTDKTKKKRTNAVYVAVWSQDGKPLNDEVVKAVEAKAQEVVNTYDGLLMTAGRE